MICAALVATLCRLHAIVLQCCAVHEACKSRGVDRTSFHMNAAGAVSYHSDGSILVYILLCCGHISTVQIFDVSCFACRLVEV